MSLSDWQRPKFRGAPTLSAMNVPSASRYSSLRRADAITMRYFRRRRWPCSRESIDSVSEADRRGAGDP